MEADIASRYEIPRTAQFLRDGGYTRVALQFPDEMLKDAAAVARALRRELASGGAGVGVVRVFVMADTAYNSCCVDEVGASHIDAQCVVHYGHACMSPTSNLPAFFVFGKAPLDVHTCASTLLECSRKSNKRILVLYGLEYAYALKDLRRAFMESCKLNYGNPEVHYAEVMCSVMSPSSSITEENKIPQSSGPSCNGDVSRNSEVATFLNNRYGVECSSSTQKYSLGGIAWNISVDEKMENYFIFWIGQDNSAFANTVLTFNKCEIVRYDAIENQLTADVSHLMKILRRRYYLVEKAKDANIIGILVGTLGVAGYLHIIEQMKDLIRAAGKKSYTLVMGRPNSAKLANFPECEVFIYVSCAQTALLDSKDFLAPVITPFEAVLSFSRGREWTGEYLLDFKDLITSEKQEVVSTTEEAHFSFIKGVYVEDNCPRENEEQSETSLALAEATEKAGTNPVPDTPRGKVPAMLAAQPPSPLPEVSGEDESSCLSRHAAATVFMEFMTKVAQFEELAESGDRLLGRFCEELEYFRRPQIPKESDVMNLILKSNCTIRMRSYIEAGCRLHCQNISNINQLSSCEDRLKDHIKKVKTLLEELECLVENVYDITLTASLSALEVSDSQCLSTDCCSMEDVFTQGEDKSADQLDSDVSFVMVMVMVRNMLKLDYTMQEKIVSALSLKTPSSELEGYCLMSDLRPYIDDYVMRLAWNMCP